MIYELKTAPNDVKFCEHNGIAVVHHVVLVLCNIVLRSPEYQKYLFLKMKLEMTINEVVDHFDTCNMADYNTRQNYDTRGQVDCLECIMEKIDSSETEKKRNVIQSTFDSQNTIR